MISFKCLYAQYHYNKQIITYLQIITILISCGNVGFWDNLNFPNNKWLIKSTKHKLTDLFINDWKNECENNTSCSTYRFLIHVFDLKIILELYLYYQLKSAVGEESLGV